MIRFWEHDVERDAASCVDRIKDAARKQAKRFCRWDKWATQRSRFRTKAVIPTVPAQHSFGRCAQGTTHTRLDDDRRRVPADRTAVWIHTTYRPPGPIPRTRFTARVGPRTGRRPGSGSEFAFATVSVLVSCRTLCPTHSAGSFENRPAPARSVSANTQATHGRSSGTVRKARNRPDGGGGGNRTRVRKSSATTSTCISGLWAGTRARRRLSLFRSRTASTRRIAARNLSLVLTDGSGRPPAKPA